MSRRLLLLLLLLPTFGGCAYPWAVKGQHTLKLSAPDSVAPGAIYTFQVDVVDASGQTLPHAHYGWLIDWPEVRGITHTGVSTEPQKMVVKGGAGKALLRLYVQDEKGRWTQIDKFDFKVE